uniref:Uncharacterized protein n=1 Tax=Megaselia scalaris TaxID=36166 RepID=T1H2Y1_MEGSC
SNKNVNYPKLYPSKFCTNYNFACVFYNIFNKLALGDGHAAGKPSNWEQSRRSSFAGRRSRRNSFSDDSQLTIENFGGSQDQLNTIGRNYERERERKTSTTSISAEPAIPLRSSIADARGTLQLGYDTDSGSEKQDRETEKHMRRQGSIDNVSIRKQEGDETPKR